MPLLGRYTRQRPESDAFFTTVNVFVMELMKVTACTFLLIKEHISIARFSKDVVEAIIGNPIETLKIIYQLKIFTTAILMRLMLGRKLSSAQWVALALLVVGAADVQWSSSGDASHSNAWKSTQKPFIGLCAVATMCVTSAIAGVYLEKVLKASNTHIWMQNIRLSLIGLPLSLFSMLYYEREGIVKDGMFHGWDIWVLLLTATNSLGGLLISVVIKYADNILKAYAQNGAIVGAVIGSWLLFSVVPSAFFMLGAFLVMLSVLIYSSFPYTPPVYVKSFI